MDGEDGGHEGTAPHGAGHAREGGEEQQRRQAVERDVGEQVAAGRLTIEGMVDPKREVSEGDPVAEVRLEEVLGDALGAQPLRQVRVLDDVPGIVVVDEVVVPDLGEGRRHEGDQNQGVQPMSAHGR